VLLAALMLAAVSLALPGVSPATDTHPDLVEYVLLSPQPASTDIMNDEIPHVDVMGDDLVFLWETDYTHWPNPDGTQPIEYPEDEDVQVRFLRDGELTPVFNVSSEGVKPEGYGHRPAMTVYDGKLHVWWNSHAWSVNGSFTVVMRVYDPTTDTWDAPRNVVEPPEGGLAAGASAAELDGRLWFVWQMRVPVGENETDHGLEIYGRWYDGSEWGPVFHVGSYLEGQDTEPSIVSTGETLHVVWNHDDPVKPGNADIHHRMYTVDGGWSVMTEELGNGPGRNDKKVRLVDWNGTPVMLWQSDGINLQGRVYSDAMLAVYGDDKWGTPRVINPPGNDAGNVIPHAVAYRDRLYVVWATSDDGITTGTDLDVALRDFDGERFGDIVVLSPEDTEKDGHPSDDGSPKLVVFEGNLYVVFDAIFSPITDGNNKDVVLRYVGYDMDGDQHDDQVDVFPLNPTEWEDTDGDGVGNNADAYPNDRTRWVKESDDGSWWSRNTGILVLAVGIVIGALIFGVTVVTRKGEQRETGEPPKS
jgi:hypothetical protein